MKKNYHSLSREELLVKIEELEKTVNQLEQQQDSALEDRLRIELAKDTVHMARWGMDVVSGMVEFHKSKAEMLGYPKSRFNHYTDFTDLVHPDDYEIAMESMEITSKE
ncbi:hypothetical protein MASR1M107_03540 [Ignavibacteriales bacterium]